MDAVGGVLAGDAYALGQQTLNLPASILPECHLPILPLHPTLLPPGPIPTPPLPIISKPVPTINPALIPPSPPQPLSILHR